MVKKSSFLIKNRFQHPRLGESFWSQKACAFCRGVWILIYGNHFRAGYSGLTAGSAEKTWSPPPELSITSPNFYWIVTIKCIRITIKQLMTGSSSLTQMGTFLWRIRRLELNYRFWIDFFQKSDPPEFWEPKLRGEADFYATLEIFDMEAGSQKSRKIQMILIPGTTFACKFCIFTADHSRKTCQKSKPN